MYPIHWMEGGTDHTNYGFNGVCSNMTKVTDNGTFDVLFEEGGRYVDAWSFTTDLTFATASTSSGTAKNIACAQIERGDPTWVNKGVSTTQLWFAALKVTDGGSTATIATLMIIDESKQRHYYDLTGVYNSSSRRGHVAAICNKGSYRVYVGGNIVTQLSGDAASKAASVFPDTLNMFTFTASRTPRFSSATIDIAFDHVKLYDCVISKQQVLDDYHPLVVHYLLDGTGNLSEDDTLYQEECDASGGHLYDVKVLPEGKTMTLQNIKNPIRDKCISMPADAYLVVDYPYGTKAVYLAFWVCPTSSDRNIDLVTWGNVVLASLLTADTGYDVGSGNASTVATIPINEWSLISIRIGKAYMLERFIDIRVNGEMSNVTNIVSTTAIQGGITIHGIDGYLSDIRLYENELTDSEVKRLYMADVAIDDQCTFHTSRLTEDETIGTFGFAEGEVRAKGFACLEEDDENSAFFDPDDGILRIKNFKQV